MTPLYTVNEAAELDFTHVSDSRTDSAFQRFFGPLSVLRSRDHRVKTTEP
jgi:hypothetical protein